MHLAVDKDDRDLVGIKLKQLWVLQNRELSDPHPGKLSRNSSQHRPRVIAQVASGFRNQRETGNGHSNRLIGMAPATMRNSEPTPVLAFFDVDNTLLRGASMYHIARAAWRKRLITVRDILRFGWHQARFVAVGENHGHMNHIRRRAMQLVGGHHESDLIALATSTFTSDIQPNLWPETLELAREHLRQGHEVWLITATPQIMAQVIADKLGLTGALGTIIESVDGVFTGELVGPLMHGSHKATEASKLAGERGAALDDCWAYSDSRNDIPLLSVVGNRVVINPDSALAAHAAELQWPVRILHPASIRAARREVRRGAPRGGGRSI